MELSEQMLSEAISLGACEERIKGWDKSWGVKDLLQYYKMNPNWCMENKFPSLDILKANKVSDMGIYVDECVSLYSPLELIYMFINCTVGAVVTNITRFYFSLGSKAKIIVKAGADLVVDYYDDTFIDIEVRRGGQCTVNRYGNLEPIIVGQNFKIRDKRG